VRLSYTRPNALICQENMQSSKVSKSLQLPKA
jgi:hypothetical protein